MPVAPKARFPFQGIHRSKLFSCFTPPLSVLFALIFAPAYINWFPRTVCVVLSLTASGMCACINSVFKVSV